MELHQDRQIRTTGKAAIRRLTVGLGQADVLCEQAERDGLRAADAGDGDDGVSQPNHRSGGRRQRNGKGATHTSMNLRPLAFSTSFWRSEIQTGSSSSANETRRTASRSRSKPAVPSEGGGAGGRRSATTQAKSQSAQPRIQQARQGSARTLDGALELGEGGLEVVRDGGGRQDGLLVVLEERRGGGKQGRRCEDRGKGSGGTHGGWGEGAEGVEWGVEEGRVGVDGMRWKRDGSSEGRRLAWAERARSAALPVSAENLPTCIGPVRQVSARRSPCEKPAARTSPLNPQPTPPLGSSPRSSCPNHLRACS